MEAGVTSTLGLLDSQDMWPGLTGGQETDQLTGGVQEVVQVARGGQVQVVHSYTTTSEQLEPAPVQPDQPPIISFQQPVL